MHLTPTTEPSTTRTVQVSLVRAASMYSAFDSNCPNHYGNRVILGRLPEPAVPATQPPEPGTVLRQIVQLTNDARFDVPTTFVCCSIPSSQVMELIKAGHPMFAEVANLKSVDYVDLPTGHWPMWSRPSDLARILASESSNN